MWGNLVTPYPVIRDVRCFAVTDESVWHSTSLLQGKCGALFMLDNVGQPCDSTYLVIRHVYCLAVTVESVLHSTSLLQGKCGALIMLDTVVPPSDSIPGDSGCVLLGSEP